MVSGCELRITEVVGDVGLEDAPADRLLVVGAGENPVAFLGHDDRRARVLAHRQDPARGDIRVLEQIKRNESVVGRRLGIVQDGPQLSEVAGPQIVGDVEHGLPGEEGERLGLNPQEAVVGRVERGHVFRAQ
jgi:hypothetical protein